jgi:hypothetical protein
MQQQPPPRKTGVNISRDETGKVRGAQYRDPKSGKAEIEAVMAYQEPPPSPPRVRKASVSKPLPWKVKERQESKTKDAALKQLQNSMWSALHHKQATDVEEVSPSEQNVRLSRELPSGPVPFPTNAPHNMGTVRVVKRDNNVPFSRDVPAATLAVTAVKPMGTNLQPPDGRKTVVPLQGHDPSTDVITFRAKPQGPSPARATAPEPELDILGRPVRKAPPPAPAVQDDAKREYDYFKNVMSRHTLVDIAKEKAAGRQPLPQAHVDVDIFGKPTARHEPRILRQGMFPGDEEHLALFDDGTGKLAPLSEKARLEMTTFPDYISNPTTMPKVRDGISEKVGFLAIGRGPTPTGNAKPSIRGGDAGSSPTNHTDFAVPGLGVSAKTGPAAFYTSSVYQKILVGSGFWGLRPLRQSLRNMDKNNDGILSRSEFINACLKASLDFSEPEISALMNLAPPKQVTPEGKPSLIPPKADFPAHVLIPTFMEILRGGDLPFKRRQVVIAAFQRLCVLAKKPPFSLTLEDIMNTTDFSGHPQFAPHIRGSLREISQAYSAAWGLSKSRTSVITEDDFIGFFHDFSPLIKNDADYIRVVKHLHSL